jgi:hypothetical protein
MSVGAMMTWNPENGTILIFVWIQPFEGTDAGGTSRKSVRSGPEDLGKYGTPII